MLEDIWKKQSQWSQAADDLKERVVKARELILLFTILGAVLSTAGAVAGLDTTAGKVCVFVAAAAAGLAAIANSFTGKQGVEPWTRARSVSEAIKSEVYTYLPRAGAYASGNPDTRLVTQVAKFEQDAADLHPTAQRFKPKRRDPPDIPDDKAYALKRVKGQIDSYYRDKAGSLDQHVRWARRAEVALGAISAVLAAAAGTWEIDDLAVWVPVIAAVTAAIGAHVAAERWSFLALEYSRTALQLESLYTSFKLGTLSGGDFVVKCEDVITVQNAGWMAKLAGP